MADEISIGAVEEEEERTLAALLEASRTPEGRSHLTSSGTLASILPTLPTSPPRLLLLLLRLRLLRNLCAGDAANQKSFVASGGPDRVAAAVLGPPHAPPQALKVALQILGNVALAEEPHRAAVWARFFPAGFLSLARSRDPGVCGTLCMVLDTCCSAEGGRRRLSSLCEVGRGLPVVLDIISTAVGVGYEEEWFEWLFAKICIEEQHLSLLFQHLSSSNASDSSGGMECQTTIFTREQAFLLRVLSKCLSERPGDVIVTNGFALGVLNILKKASCIVDFYSRGSSALPTSSPEVDVLGYSLTILRDACAWEGPSTAEDPVTPLLLAGLLELLLRFLGELEPPSIVRKSIVRARDQAMATTMDEPLKVCPYQGFRRDVVSIISNCVHRRKQVQDEIRERNGIMILLQQCVVDEGNPFLREWGLLAVRNLLEGNLENQREVADLQLQEPINTPEIAGLGLRVEIDSERRRAKLVNIS